MVYKHLATLYFVFVFDNSENELAMLDLVQGNMAIESPFFFSYQNCQAIFMPKLKKAFSFA